MGAWTWVFSWLTSPLVSHSVSHIFPFPVQGNSPTISFVGSYHPSGRASARPPPLSTPPLAPTASGPTMRFPFRFFGGNGCHPHHMGWWGKNATGQLLMRRNGRYRLTCQVFVERMSHRPKKEEQHEGAQELTQPGWLAENGQEPERAKQSATPRWGMPEQADSPARSSRRRRRCAKACA